MHSVQVQTKNKNPEGKKKRKRETEREQYILFSLPSDLPSPRYLYTKRWFVVVVGGGGGGCGGVVGGGGGRGRVNKEAGASPWRQQG